MKKVFKVTYTITLQDLKDIQLGAPDSMLENSIEGLPTLKDLDEDAMWGFFDMIPGSLEELLMPDSNVAATITNIDTVAVELMPD